jgi:hypothetical protein
MTKRPSIGVVFFRVSSTWSSRARAAHLEGYYYRPRMDKVLVEIAKSLDTSVEGRRLLGNLTPT